MVSRRRSAGHGGLTMASSPGCGSAGKFVIVSPKAGRKADASRQAENWFGAVAGQSRGSSYWRVNRKEVTSHGVSVIPRAFRRTRVGDVPAAGRRLHLRVKRARMYIT